MTRSCFGANATDTPSELFFYGDTDGALRPYTQYAYAVEARTGGGVTRSPLSVIITPEAAPNGVLVPSADDIGARHVVVSWSRPLLSNGIILSYLLSRNGSQIANDSIPSMFNDTSVQPFRVYAYVLSVCTIAGCAKSSPLIAVTLESSPEGVLAPTAVAVSSTVMSVAWMPPATPNGYILQYRIYVNSMTTASLQTDSTMRSSNVSGLLPFVVYTFIVEACTAAGCSRSSASKMARTLPSAPQGLSAPAALALTSSSVDVSWSAPASPNGILSSYIVYRNASQVAVLPAIATNFVDSNLTSHTVYSYTIEAINQAGSVLSTHTAVRTAEDTPEGLRPPVVTALNSTAFSVVLPAPIEPNGVIVNYSVIVDSIGQAVSLNMQQTAVLGGFQPFTQHTFRSEVCTAIGCAFSTSTTQRLLQALAVGIDLPNVTVLGATSVRVDWTTPSLPNGILSRYIVQRREPSSPLSIFNVTIQPASNTVLTTIDGQLRPYTTYEYRVGVENGAGTAFGGWESAQTAESIPQGITIVSLVGLQRSVSLAWAPPTMPNGIVTQYEVYYRDRDTLNESLAITATTGPLNATVDNLTPFTYYEFRVAALTSAGAGYSLWQLVLTLPDRPEQVQPITVAQKAADGKSLNLTWDPPLLPNGIIQNYIVRDVSGGHSLYQGVLRSFLFLRLTPYTPYTVQLSACNSVGCSSGSVQTVTTAEIPPTSQAPPSAHAVGSREVRVTWQQPAQPNGVITSYVIRRKEASQPDSSAVNILLRDPRTDSSFSFIDSALEPYSEYRYQVEANNSVGSVLSQFSQIVRTLADSPEGIPAPTVLTQTSTSIQLTWQAPTKPNGPVSGYEVIRNGTSIAGLSGTARSYTDSSRLKPFVVYSYRLRVCTSGGNCSFGPTAAVRTLSAPPSGVTAPTLTVVNSTAIRADWLLPAAPNGIISGYNVTVRICMAAGPEGNISLPGSASQLVLSPLLPFTCYEVDIEACTSAGCARSTMAQTTTAEGAPQGVPAPSVTIVSADSLLVTVQPPTQPNGRLRTYSILRNGTGVHIFNGTDVANGQTLTFLDSGLQSNTKFSYVVVIATGGGSTTSGATVANTNPRAPQGLSAPTATATGPDTIDVSWKAPAIPNSPILYYELRLNDRLVFNGTALSYTARSLTPYTQYKIQVKACSLFGCNNSTIVRETTLESAPGGMAMPQLTTSGPRQVNVRWQAPVPPNGFILNFIVERRLVIQGVPENASVVVTVNGSTLMYADTSVEPVSLYEFRVSVKNSVGSSTSGWSLVSTGEDTPEQVHAPQLRQTTSTSLRVFIASPGQPNGVIISYNVLVDGSRSSSVQVEGQLANITDLKPYTAYALTAEVCTRAGCTLSATPLLTRTGEAIPVSIAAPVVLEVNSTSVGLQWSPPQMPNGVIVRLGCGSSLQVFVRACVCVNVFYEK